MSPRAIPRSPAAAEGWWVYVLLCAHDRLYVGIARDVDARFAAHCAGKGAIYTRLNSPLRVLARERHATRGDALRAEYALKQLTKARKLEWIATQTAPRRPFARRRLR